MWTVWLAILLAVLVSGCRLGQPGPDIEATVRAVVGQELEAREAAARRAVEERLKAQLSAQVQELAAEIRTTEFLLSRLSHDPLFGADEPYGPADQACTALASGLETILRTPYALERWYLQGMDYLELEYQDRMAVPVTGKTYIRKTPLGAAKAYTEWVYERTRFPHRNLAREYVGWREFRAERALDTSELDRFFAAERERPSYWYVRQLDRLDERVERWARERTAEMARALLTSARCTTLLPEQLLNPEDIDAFAAWYVKEGRP